MEERVMCMSWHKDKNNQEIQTYLELERNIENTFYPEMKTIFLSRSLLQNEMKAWNVEMVNLKCSNNTLMEEIYCF